MTALAAPAFTAAFLHRNRVETVVMSDRTTFRIGGPATVVTLESRQDLEEILAVEPRVLGRGANLLVGDAGADHVVLRLGQAFSAMEMDDPVGGTIRVRAGAGADLPVLVARCLRVGAAGLEALAGIPGTVGGALRMNAGGAEGWIMDRVVAVEVLLPGEPQPRWVERAAIPAGYRDGGLPVHTLILGCDLELSVGDPAALTAAADGFRTRKAASQPLAARSAGCVFKNPRSDLPAGRLIDQLGFKGMRQGDALVSPVHANFIVNTGAATAADVTTLIHQIRQTAWIRQQVALELEIETWNCDERLRMHPRHLEDGHG